MENLQGLTFDYSYTKYFMRQDVEINLEITKNEDEETDV